MATIETSSGSSQNALLRAWNNKEARGVIIQILTVAIVFGLGAYLVRNAMVNLEARGKGIDFGFLMEPASYDIGFSPFLEYTSRSPHIIAAIVGLLNTLLVAVCGVILATIIGFLIGVLRLSHNYLISRLAYCYVEMIRNVPVLLWILLLHGTIINTLPQVRNAINFSDTFFVTNRGLFLPSPVFEPAIWFTFIAFAVGVVAAIVYARRAKRIQDETGKISPVLWVSLGLVFGLPIVVLLASGIPLTWDYPALKGFNFKGGMSLKPEFLALWLALSLYTSSFIAEIVRAGIQSVSHGQTEAAHALGLRNNRSLQLVVVPQALRVIVPPLTSQYLNLTKNSSLAIAISYYDLVATLGGITLNQTGREMETMSMVLLVYLAISLLISSFMNWYNNRIKLVER